MEEARHRLAVPAGITTVLFDYSGVLTTSLALPDEPPFDAAKMLDVMLPALLGSEVHRWHELERGEITIDEWIDYVEIEVPGGGVMFDPSSPLNAMARLEIRDDHLALAVELRSAGYTVGVLTNNVAAWRPLWRDRLPPELFHVIIDSSEVGMRKPESRIYELAMAECQANKPSEVVFIDDFEENVNAAKRLGMEGVHCAPGCDLRAELEHLGLLL